MRKFLTLENFVLLTLFLIVLNIIFLDLNYFQSTKQVEEVASPLQNNENCPDCKSKIESLEESVTKLMEKTGITVTPSPIVMPVSQTTTQNPEPTLSVKEYYVPFGSGTGAYSDWTDIPGLQAYIDNTSYGKIKTVIFEASLHIPTGNQTASIRLINATDGRVIANSQLDFSGNTESKLLSSTISLDYGQKLYKVQLKTQLKYNAVLDQSRVHITAQ